MRHPSLFTSMLSEHLGGKILRVVWNNKLLFFLGTDEHHAIPRSMTTKIKIK